MFLAELRERFALDAEILDGAEEARLTYLGAYAERPPAAKTMVVDIGGGSTELVIGDGPEVGFSPRCRRGPCATPSATSPTTRPRPPSSRSSPPTSRGLIAEALEGAALAQANFGIGVAGTPTSLAAIEQRLDPYDPELVHGYRLSLGSIQRMLSSSRSMPLAERLAGPGPARGPGADDRRRGGDPDPGHARLRARPRSRSPSTTSSGARRSTATQR